MEEVTLNKAVRLSVSLRQNQIDRVKELAKREHGGLVSRVVSDAVDAYLGGSAPLPEPAHSERPIYELLRRYRPAILTRFDRLTGGLGEGFDESAILDQLLASLVDALARMDADILEDPTVRWHVGNDRESSKLNAK